MYEFPLEVGEHVGIGVHAVVFVVKLFDRVWQLGVNCETAVIPERREPLLLEGM